MMKIMMKLNSIKEIVTGASNDTQHQNNAHTKTNPTDCDWELLTNAQCHIVHSYYDIGNAELYN